MNEADVRKRRARKRKAAPQDCKGAARLVGEGFGRLFHARRLCDDGGRIDDSALWHCCELSIIIRSLRFLQSRCHQRRRFAADLLSEPQGPAKRTGKCRLGLRAALKHGEVRRCSAAAAAAAAAAATARLDNAHAAERDAARLEERAVERYGLVLAALAALVEADEVAEPRKVRAQLADWAPEHGGREAEGRDLDEHGLDAAAHHVVQQAALAAAPEPRQRLQRQAAAHGLDAQPLVVAQHGAAHHRVSAREAPHALAQQQRKILGLIQL